MAVEEEGHAAVAALHGYDINGTKMNVEVRIFYLAHNTKGHNKF